MEPSEYIDCPSCDGRGAIEEDTGEPIAWSALTAVECGGCDGAGQVVNPEHVERCKYLLRELLDSFPFIEELSNANYHSVQGFLEELRDNEW